MIGLTIAAVALLGQDTEIDDASARRIAHFKSELSEQISTELAIAAGLGELRDQSSQDIEDTLLDAAAKVAQTLVASGVPNVPQPLTTTLTDMLVRDLKAANAGLARRYTDDLATRRALHDQAVRTTAVAMIDLRLRLTSKQRPQVLAMLEKEWKGVRFVDPSRLDWESPRKLVPRLKPLMPWRFPTEPLLQLLTEENKAAWKFHQQRLTKARTGKTAVTETSEFAEILAHDLKIMTVQLRLADRQQRRLRLLAKRTARRANQLQSKAKAAGEYGDSPSLERLAQWEVDYATDPEICKRLAGWRSAVWNELTEEQRSQVAAEQRERTRFFHEARMQFQVARFCPVHGWNAAEASGLLRLLVECPMDDRAVWSSTRVISQFLGLSDDKLATVLSPEHVGQFRGWLDFIERFHRNGPVQ